MSRNKQHPLSGILTLDPPALNQGFEVEYTISMLGTIRGSVTKSSKTILQPSTKPYDTTEKNPVLLPGPTLNPKTLNPYRPLNLARNTTPLNLELNP